MSTKPESPSSPRFRLRAAHGVILIGLALFALLVWHFGYANLLAVLREAQPIPLFWMALLTLAGFWLRAWKWRYALGAGQQAIGIFFLAKMAGNWSPGRVGELSPLLIRRHRTPRVATWILADRILEVAFTLIMGFMGALSLKFLPDTMLYTALLVTFLLALVLVLILCKRPPLPKWIRLKPADQPQRLRDKCLAIACQFFEEIHYLGGKTPLILTLTLAAKTTDMVAVMALCAAFGYFPGFFLVCAARCAHALVSAVPVTPDATGVPFVAAALLLHEYGAMPYETLTVALAFEVAAINLLLWLSFCLAAWDLRSRPEL